MRYIEADNTITTHTDEGYPCTLHFNGYRQRQVSIDAREFPSYDPPVRVTVDNEVYEDRVCDIHIGRYTYTCCIDKPAPVEDNLGSGLTPEEHAFYDETYQQVETD